MYNHLKKKTTPGLRTRSRTEDTSPDSGRVPGLLMSLPFTDFFGGTGRGLFRKLEFWLTEYIQGAV